VALVATRGCDEEAGRDVAPVTIDGHTFHLELALDDETRMKGLSFRESIAEDGGMLFVFPNAARRAFVMRDCLADIDILFLDGAGRVVAMHHMPVEPPRDPQKGEGTFGGDNTSRQTYQYENRLKRYSSRFSAQVAIELRGGWLDKLNVKEGDRIRLDLSGLKKRAR